MPIKFKCCVDGQPLPFIKWFINDEEVFNGKDYLIYSDLTDQFLFIPKSHSNMSGRVTLKASNTFGEVETSCVLAVESIFI